MKKYFSIIWLLFFVQFLSAQSNIVNIGSGTATFSFYPFASAQKYGWSTQIYKAADIGIAGTITSISFDVSNNPSNVVMNNQKIYVRHTTTSNYNDITYPGTSGFTLVYDGTITYNGSGWKQINFSTNFNYNGVDDIEFLFENRSNVTNSTVQFRGTTTMPEYRLKRDYSATSFPTTSTAPASRLTYQTNAQLTIISCFFNEGSLSANSTTVQAFQPVNLTLSGQDVGASIQWQRSTDNINYTVISGNTSNTHSETMLSTPLYFRTITTKNGCSKFSNVVTITPDACYTQTAEIGTGTLALERSPYNGYYNYSWSSIIYKSSEIGGAGKLSGISFYVNNNPSNFTMNNQKIYVRHTTALNYSGTSSYPGTSGFTLIYDGSITYNGSGWKQIPFTTAFDYNGTSNLEFLYENRDASGGSGFPTFRYTVVSGEGNRTQRDYLDANFPSSASANFARVTNVPNIKLTRELPPLEVTASSTKIAIGETTNLTATGGGTSYTWSPSSSLSNSTIANPVATPTVTTTYSVTTTTVNGCSKTKTITIEAVLYHFILNTTLLSDTIIGNDSTYIIGKINNNPLDTIISGGIDTFNIPPGPGGAVFEFNFQKSNILETKIICKANRYGDIDSVLIWNDTTFVPLDSTFFEIRNKNELLIIPLNSLSTDISKLTTYLNLEGGLVLSPNGDNNYDYLTLHGGENLTTFDIGIYDLNNTLIYESDQKNFQWDGKDTNGILKKGTYRYELLLDGLGLSGRLVIDF